MHQSYFSLLDMAIVGVPVFVIGIWQLVSINREIAKDEASREDDSPKGSGHPVGEHRLDDR
ncbi:hypothetical protein [Sphingomonas sp.]|uniref:hypothetical protein n=1 Tax=Sphingomonas sp. TaxID=28214 RepID=UPI0035BBAA6C